MRPAAVSGSRQTLVHTSVTKRSSDFIARLDRIGMAYGSTGRTRPLVVVLDNGPIHTSKSTAKALAERPWLSVEWLPARHGLSMPHPCKMSSV